MTKSELDRLLVDLVKAGCLWKGGWMIKFNRQTVEVQISDVLDGEMLEDSEIQDSERD
jgi:hypothetical protein